MLKLLRNYLLAMLSLGIVGCASTNPLPRRVFWEDEQNTIRLPATGRLLVLQKLKKAKHCQAAQAKFRVKIKSDRESKKIATLADCALYPGHLVLKSKSRLKKGFYRVEIQSGTRKFFKGGAWISAHYNDKNFNSSKDGRSGGAKAWESQAPDIEGAVNYGGGDATDWFQIRGQGAWVNLSLEADRGVRAKVYRRVSGERNSLLARLKPGQKKGFRLKGDDLFVAVNGEKYKGKAKYRLWKSHGPFVRRQSLEVIDAYQVSPQSALALIQPVPGLKLQDEVEILGKTAQGREVALGSCEITELDAKQASCHLAGRVLPTNLVGYRAVMAMGAE